MNVLITGGAGFIGANAAQRYLEPGDTVTVVDDLTRPGAEKNLAWLDGRGDLRFHRVDRAVPCIGRCARQVYSIGGGSATVLSLVELLEHIEGRFGAPIPAACDDWRPGDQRVYISDIRKASRDFGGSPKISKVDGLERLCDFVAANKELFT